MRFGVPGEGFWKYDLRGWDFRFRVQDWQNLGRGGLMPEAFNPPGSGDQGPRRRAKLQPDVILAELSFNLRQNVLPPEEGPYVHLICGFKGGFSVYRGGFSRICHMLPTGLLYGVRIGGLRVRL